MCLKKMVMVEKSVEKKTNEDVTCKNFSVGTVPVHSMSRGTALFSCGIMEASRWRDVDMWSPLEASPGHCSSLSTLLQDLDLSSTAPPTVQPWSNTALSFTADSTDPCSTAPPGLWSESCSTGPPGLWSESCFTAPPGLWSESCSTAPPGLWSESFSTEPPGLWSDPCSTAPPTKRQCRSLSCFDDLSRSSWRPQGSRLWTSVEKRRYHSGGSVQRPSTSSNLHLPSIKRSSSVSLAFPGTHCPPVTQKQLSFSPHGHTPTPPSSPHSSPERASRCGDKEVPGLPRSQSHPCVLNEMKIGVKRRRQEDGNKRPSLDLAKMTQKLRSFHSLSCPGFPSDDPHDHTSSSLENKNSNQLYAETSELGTKASAGERPFCDTIEDCSDVTALSANQKPGEALWAGRCSLYALGGELDLEQIERN